MAGRALDVASAEAERLLVRITVAAFACALWLSPREAAPFSLVAPSRTVAIAGDVTLPETIASVGARVAAGVLSSPDRGRCWL
ncbi:MAG: hypothetical protein JWL84_274 [Rhodospirillales bacterium]|nr:hypothetical protein [Rhodospirillales bacterium]